jgi:glutamate dehydrogenase
MKEHLKSICDKLILPQDLTLPENLNKTLDLEISDEISSTIKIFSSSHIPISKIIPILSDFGFVVISEVTFEIDSIFITKLKIDTKTEGLLHKHSKNIKTVLLSALSGDLKSGRLFELVYSEDFCKRGVLLFRSFVAYTIQLVEEFNERDLVDCLVKYPMVCGEFLDYFLIKFDPSINDRESKLERSSRRVDEHFKDIQNINDDRVLKLFLKFLKSITRTNFFKNSDTISHKIDLTNLKKHLRGIQPNIEAFVYAPDLKGVHQRVSKVCRGGIRWSNREDFRSEVKSLMATQEAKNAVIVPKGAKGGFLIIKESVSKEEFESYYKRFINALLDLVDNQESGNIIHPKDMVCYDGYDSYFVVAADKGTSSMSDVANSIAKERGFWIGDAFASGSSTGYHHKKLGITAKGAIRSTQRHFIEKGVDFYKEPINVVGVGSMSGDVFGNGMLESANFRLIAAISHDEIFIDPNPDLDVAYGERKELFITKRGKWSDYDKSKISQGGGVFKRSSKSISLTPEISKLLNTSQTTMSGEDLAKELLKLSVDLLYFGGIGTYIKSSDESNLDLGDKENEYVRVNANEIKAYAICEGANLALTMSARLEYALNGGHINLDSIDNSAGVDTSDHEVNYKIALNIALSDDKISENERVQLLHGMSDFVVEKVLETNFKQALCISEDQARSKEDLKSFKKVVRVLESEMDIFKRHYFLIPKDRDFGEVVDDDDRVIRPILATLMLYAKIFLQDKILESRLVKESFCEKFLFEYFPKEFSTRFKYQIKNHPLRYEIISMMMANQIINQEGVSFLKDFGTDNENDFIKKVENYIKDI